MFNVIFVQFIIIGERRLDPDANLAAVLKVNPNAEWVLKGRVKK